MRQSAIISDVTSLIKNPSLLLKEEVFITKADYEILKKYSKMESANYLMQNIKEKNIIELKEKPVYVGYSREQSYFIACIDYLLQSYDLSVLTNSQDIKCFCMRKKINLFN